ncbi:DnaJ domain-containing protein [Candidatus Wolfebacteria bacterium]|nr:DnaJ domain-containing protein [Candidatus Wolfebacteria bacterium]
MKDFYKILEIEKGASDSDIKKAYRRLAHKYHPDKSGGDEQKFKEINEAYQVLSNKNKRAQYDRFGQTFDGAGPGGFSGFGGQGFNINMEDLERMGGLGDIFDMFFEGAGIKRKKKTYDRGADIEVVKEINLEDAYKGVKADLSIKTFVSCKECSGQGHFTKDGFTKCSTCDGQGQIRENRRTIFGQFSQVRTCDKCYGRGEMPNKICKECSGTGRVNSKKDISIDIAAGIHDGQLIKVVGAGQAGERGAGAGDLYIRVQVRPHKIFKRFDNDLLIKQDLNVLELLAGKKIELPTIEGGKIKVEIPVGFNLKERLRIAGEGMPKFGGYGRGDLYIEFDIKNPKVSKKLKDFLEDEI